MLAPRTTVWAARLLWLLVGVCGAGAVADAVDARSSALRLVTMVQLWTVFGVVLVALVVPSTVSLTIVRMAAPLAVAAAVATSTAGAGAALGTGFVAFSVLNALVAASGDLGEAFVQASAYGDEHRYPLRPPAGFLVPVAVSWCAWCAAMLAGPLLVGTRQWVVGGVLVAVAACLTWVLAPRYHRLSRRWLVLVPAGVVVHDQVVLAESAMVQRPNVAAIGLALAGTEAADFTGPSAGHAIEVAVRQPITVMTAPTRSEPRGVALHVRSFLVAPTRPGRALRTAAARKLPVG